MRKKKSVSICICVPVDDGARHEFWLSLMGFMNAVPALFKNSVTFVLQTNPGDSLITRSRNNLAHRFLHTTEADYLLFLDTDLDFHSEDIKRLIDKRREDALICGQYAIKQADLRMCHNPLKGEEIGPDDLLKVAEAGTGCMLIPRKILLKFAQEFSALEYTDDQFKDKRISFFDVGVVKGKEDSRYLSEDWLFCRRVRQLGFSVYVDTGILLGHHGWIRYPLDDSFLISAIASRAVSVELLRDFKRHIDKAARARWKLLYKQNSIRQSKRCKGLVGETAIINLVTYACIVGIESLQDTLVDGGWKQVSHVSISIALCDIQSSPIAPAIGNPVLLMPRNRTYRLNALTPTQTTWELELIDLTA